MIDESHSYPRWAMCALLLGATGCDDDTQVGPVATHVSRSSTIALADDRSRVAMVNPDDGSISVFETAGNTRVSQTATGGSPSSVAIAPDGKTAFVANRADGTVVRVTGIDGASPAVDAMVSVGSEPVGVALSPTGKLLFVAELAQSEVSVIDTKTLTVKQTIAVDRPRALLVTNNGDANDDDETLAITQYFGTPVPGREVKDDGRIGHVQLVALSSLAATDVALSPVDSGFPKVNDPTQTTTTAPNQLTALATHDGRLYVTSVSASPEGPTHFDGNVFPVVYVADLATATEVRDASGTTNLARKVYDAIPTPSPATPRFVPGELSDIDFLGTTNVAYAIGRAGDVMVRVTFGDSVTIGSSQNAEIDLAGNDTIGKCQAPTGLAVDETTGRAFVNCWVTRRLGIVDFATQSLSATVEASPPPASATEQSVQRGKRFYFTGRARWSAAVANGAKGGEGWSSCGSCHPDGLTDNITWSFGSGPRQTVSQDGTFSHGAGAQKQRILNYSGIFDEHHDFERNTRDVSGGLGAITFATNVADCGQLDKEKQVILKPNQSTDPTVAPIGGLQQPLKELADDPAIASCGHKDWDDIEAYVKSIQPTRGVKGDASAIQRGRQLFIEGGCAKCHGGAGWTVSRLYYTPSSSTNAALGGSELFVVPPFFAKTWSYPNGASPRTQISAQPAIAEDATGFASPTVVAIGQATCALRNVGTFGVPGDAATTSALEQRFANGALLPAEGRGGFNPPSLYGLALGAPYLHHGQAATLPDLFTDPRWGFHTNAANANFSLTLADPGKLADLIAFLLAIDASTEEIGVPTDPTTGASFDACPATFP